MDATGREDIEPSFAGYSIGKWIDEDGDGKYDVLEVETRDFKGPRVLDDAAFRCTRTISPSSRSGFISTRGSPRSCMTKSP